MAEANVATTDNNATSVPNLGGNPIFRQIGAMVGIAISVALGVAVGFGAGSGWEVMSEGSPGHLVPVQAQAPAAASGTVPEVAIQGLNERQREQISRYLLEHAQYNSIGAGHGALGYARVTSVSGQGY